MSSGFQKVGSLTPRLLASFNRPADATAYTIGDIIANSGTANLVTPLIWPDAALAVGGSGALFGARCMIGAASGAVVTTNLDIDLMVFRDVNSAPFPAAGYPADNAPLAWSTAALALAAITEMVAVFRFRSANWVTFSGGGNPSTAYQSASFSQLDGVTPGRNFAPYNMANTGSMRLLGIAVARGPWAPGAVVNNMSFILDSQQD